MKKCNVRIASIIVGCFLVMVLSGVTQATPINLSQGRAYTVSWNTDVLWFHAEQYPGEGPANANTLLTDGVFATPVDLIPTVDEAIWRRTSGVTPGVLTIGMDLGELCDITSIYVDVFKGPYYRHVTPNRISIDYSVDGETWTNFYSFSKGLETTNGGAANVYYIQKGAGVETAVEGQHVKITMELDYGSYNRYFRCDEFQIFGEVPEPATICLLSIGSMLAFLRRKK
ncbi:MAG: PEP-CTERM sorting domain-containing protein [Phycisphaerae bacterium]|jgi:hypothetical protein